MPRKTISVFTGIIVVAVVLSTLCVDLSVATAARKNKQPVLANKSISLCIGKSKKLKVKHIPKKAKINYSSKNRRIAAVTKKGKITAKKVGKTVIKVTARWGRRYKKILKCKVRVMPKKIFGKQKNVSPTSCVVPTPLPYSGPTVSPNAVIESPIVEKEGLGTLSSDIAGARIKVSEQAVFTLELAKSDISYDNMIYLYKNGQSVGCMHDDGKDGDAIAGDNIYSLKVICYSAKETKEVYKAVCNTSVSAAVELNYFDKLSEEDFKIQEKFAESFQSLEKENISVDGNIDTDSILEKVYQKAIEGQTKGVVLSASKKEDGVVIQFTSGIWYVYQPEIEDVDASGSDADVSIMTLQPYQSTYDSYYQTRSTEATDGSAMKIAQEFDNYQFDKNYDDSNVTLEVINNLSSNQVVFWHTHGFYEKEVGSMIWLGEKLSGEQLHSGKYESDYLARRIVLGKDQHIGITAGYITKYCGNLSNSFIYLGACQSGKDFRLAQSFINRGAKAVIANSETIYRGYNCNMMEDVANGLIQKSPLTQKYNTLQEALSYAKNKNGNNDYEWYPNNDHAPSTPIIYGNKNYRLSESIEVNSIELNYTNLSINIGNSVSLNATILPDNATEKSVAWSSGNTSVATVSGGIVTGKSVGNTTITAKTSNGKTATCIVTVKNSVVEVTEISLNSTSISLEAGKTTTLIATITPSNATNKTITWSSSNTSVATVSNGVVTGKSAGTATVMATTVNGKSATCQIEVFGDEILSLNYSDVSLYANDHGPLSLYSTWENGGGDTVIVNVGESVQVGINVNFYYSHIPGLQLKAYLNGSEIPASQVIWSGDGLCGYGKIDSNGYVSGNTNGGIVSSGVAGSIYETEIVATLKSNPSLSTSMKIRFIYDAKMKFSIADESIASVDDKGVVIGKKEGITTLTMKSEITGKSATCPIFVGTPLDIDAELVYKVGNQYIALDCYGNQNYVLASSSSSFYIKVPLDYEFGVGSRLSLAARNKSNIYDLGDVTLGRNYYEDGYCYYPISSKLYYQQGKIELHFQIALGNGQILRKMNQGSTGCFYLDVE